MALGSSIPRKWTHLRYTESSTATAKPFQSDSFGKAKIPVWHTQQPYDVAANQKWLCWHTRLLLEAQPVADTYPFFQKEVSFVLKFSKEKNAFLK